MNFIKYCSGEIQFYNFSQFSRKIFINEGLQMNPIQLSRAKCMFIKATRDNIYITDLGNGWILDIDMKRGSTGSRYVILE